MKKPLAVLLFFYVLFLPSRAWAQGPDYTWWDRKNNWDGVTSWSRYIVLAPGYMGPNALPVPEIKTGRLPANANLQVTVAGQFSPGDKTQSLFSSLFLPVCAGKIGLQFEMVPFEHYKMDTLTRDRRHSRDFDGKGTSIGDVYIGTFVQLLQDHEKLPDLLLTINLKTASGSNLAGARFTDAPGYAFDLSVGKTYKRAGAFLEAVRPFALIGFYSWQTNLNNNRQNDALLYGLGCRLDFRKLRVEGALGGYYGYLNKGDRPLVHRFLLRSNRQAIFNYRLQFEKGLHDFPYTILRTGCDINLQLVKERLLHLKISCSRESGSGQPIAPT